MTFLILKIYCRQTMELETLQKRHREELERFQQHQLQLLIQQQQQASAFHQHHPLLYHTITGSSPVTHNITL